MPKLKTAPKFKPTEKPRHFVLDKDRITVDIENSQIRFAWRMTVNGSVSEVYNYYAGLLEHKGYVVATDYWRGTFEAFVPTKLVKAKEVS